MEACPLLLDHTPTPSPVEQSLGPRLNIRLSTPSRKPRLMSVHTRLAHSQLNTTTTPQSTPLTRDSILLKTSQIQSRGRDHHDIQRHDHPNRSRSGQHGATRDQIHHSERTLNTQYIKAGHIQLLHKGVQNRRHRRRRDNRNGTYRGKKNLLITQHKIRNMPQEAERAQSRRWKIRRRDISRGRNIARGRHETR